MTIMQNLFADQTVSTQYISTKLELLNLDFLDCVDCEISCDDSGKCSCKTESYERLLSEGKCRHDCNIIFQFIP